MTGNDPLGLGLARLEAFRPSLRGGDLDDLDLLIDITKEAIRRPSQAAKAHMVNVLDMIFTVDPALDPIAAAARTARQAIMVVRRMREKIGH